MYFSELQSVFLQCVKCILSKQQPSLFTKGCPNPHLLFFRFLCFCPYYCFFPFSSFSCFFFFPEDCVFLVFLYYCVSEQKAGARRSNKRLIILPPSFIFLYCGSFRRHPPNQRAKQCGKIQCGKNVFFFYIFVFV